MALIIKADVNDFIRRFDEMGRKDQFSYDGKVALYDHLNNLSDDTGDDIELDVIALCCEWSEYDSLQDAKDAYDAYDFEDYTGLEDITTVLYTRGDSVVVRDF